MSQNDVEKIKERLSIEEVVGSYLKLDKAGRNLKACCPFHNEKTPSFTLSPDRGTYYCFGCHAKGDIFTFVQKFEGVDFPAALKMLADRAGITLTVQSSENREKYERLRRLLELTTKFFEVHLSRSAEATDYLKSRGLTEETIANWRLGFVPSGWDHLYTFLKKKGFNDDEIELAGLAKKGQKGKYYDRFRSRIIFPINDSSGRPVGFTGRIFNGSDDDAKYLNSPETPLFEKSKILYGFDKGKSYIRKFDFSILVEGQMDLIMAHQAGYMNAVASSGTALTQDHLHMISRISDKLVIAFDSDGAGFRASEKAWQMALSLGIDVKIAPIPAGKDPADVISESPDEWKEIIKNSKHIIDIITDQIISEDVDDRAKGKMVRERLIPYLASIASSIDQAHFVKVISDRLNISEDSIREDISKYEPDVDSRPVIEEEVYENIQEQSEIMKAERQLFGILFWQQTLEKSLLDIEKLENSLKEILSNSFDSALNQTTNEKDKLIFESEQFYASDLEKKKIEKHVEELLHNLKKNRLIKQREDLRGELGRVESEGNEEKIKEVMLKIDSVSKEISGMTG